MCDVPRCSASTELTYIGRGLCGKHWSQLCDAETPDQEDRFLERLGLIRVDGQVCKRTRARIEDRQACDSRGGRQDEKPTGLETGVEHVLDVGAEPTWSSDNGRLAEGGACADSGTTDGQRSSVVRCG